MPVKRSRPGGDEADRHADGLFDLCKITSDIAGTRRLNLIAWHTLLKPLSELFLIIERGTRTPANVTQPVTLYRGEFYAANCHNRSANVSIKSRFASFARHPIGMAATP